MLDQGKLVNICKCVPGTTPNLWILSFLSEDESRTEIVQLFRSKEGCIKHLNLVMESYNKYRMDRPNFCIEEAYTSNANYMYAVVTTQTLVIIGDEGFGCQENHIDVERVVAFNSPYMDFHDLMGIERSLGVNTDINIEVGVINE